MSEISQPDLRWNLESYAVNIAARQAVPGVMKALEPLILTVDAGVYGSQADQVTDGEITKAITLATGYGSERIERLSVDDYHSPHTHGCLGTMLLRYKGNLSINTVGLWWSLNDRVGNGLTRALQATNLKDRNLGTVSNNLNQSITTYCGFALRDDKESTARLKPLIEILPTVIPIGEKRGEPGTWICLDFSKREFNQKK